MYGRIIAVKWATKRSVRRSSQDFNQSRISTVNQNQVSKPPVWQGTRGKNGRTRGPSQKAWVQFDGLPGEQKSFVEVVKSQDVDLIYQSMEEDRAWLYCCAVSYVKGLFLDYKRSLL